MDDQQFEKADDKTERAVPSMKTLKDKTENQQFLSNIALIFLLRTGGNYITSEEARDFLEKMKGKTVVTEPDDKGFSIYLV